MSKKSPSLLEQALIDDPYPRKKGRSITPEVIELCVAWAREEITMTQVNRALKQGSAYPVVARALAEYIRRKLESNE